MRSLWKGSISFGLVNIPVKMYTASRDKEFKFVLLHKKDHSQIRYARICKAEDKEVPWTDIVKGYEYEPGEYVVLSDEDFQKANLKKTKSLEIINFVNEEEIDPIYYVKPYFLEPEKNAEKAYSLLRDALEKSKKVGIVKYVIHSREHIAVVKAFEKIIIIIELRYQDEIIHLDELTIPSVQKIPEKEINIAIQLIDQMTSPFHIEKYKDTYSSEIHKILLQKAKGKKIHAKGAEPKPSKVVDIISLLKESLEQKPAEKKSRKRVS